MNDMTLKGHEEAINYFIKMKQKGVIGAFGISTHYVAAVRAALKHPEIEVIHPITNINGLGIQDGSIDDMVEALNAFRAKGGGVYGMKPFGGGNLLKQKEACYDFVFKAEFLDSVAFGMQSKDEIDQNVNTLLGIETTTDISERLLKQMKRLEVSEWCIKCGACVKRCDHHALTMTEGGLHINREKCVMCGYCASVCPEFCLKVY